MKRQISLFLLLVSAWTARAIVLPDYTTFLHKVAEQNAGYLAEQCQIDVALAQQEAARVFRDPEVGFSYGNNQDWNLRMGQSIAAELSYTVPLGGERSANMGVANAELEVTRAAVADYFRNLQQSAAEAYANAWLAVNKAKLLHETWLSFLRVAHGDSLRWMAGDITESVAIQSAVEAHVYMHRWLNADAERLNALAALANLIGGEPVEDLQDSLLPIAPLPALSLEDLKNQAIRCRADLIRATAEHRLTEQQLRVVRASNAPELTFTAGYEYATRVRNEEAPAPPYHGFSVGVAIPLKFSSLNNGDVRAAQAGVRYAEHNCRALELQIHMEVEQAYNTWKVASLMLTHSHHHILEDAERVLQKNIESYQLGETSLFELVAARTAYNDLQLAYLEDYAELFTARAALAAAIGE